MLAFIVRVAALYALFALPWSVLEPGYIRLFCRVGDALFGSFNAYATADFHPRERATLDADTVITVETVHPRTARDVEFSARLTGYLPFAQLAAMILATPVAWRRRWIALGLGTLFLHALIALRLWCLIYIGFGTLMPQAVTIGPFLQDVLSIVASPTPAFLIPPLIWLILLFRWDWVQLLMPVPVATATRPS
ncbi:MAG: hypothetical protein D6788_01245 [Planctomycetota bacterium]|nr:MAG: hypothetical protein D6788_01245 [Planctomycetota bacterium]